QHVGVSDALSLVAAQRAARARRDAGDLDGARRILAEAMEAAGPAYGEDHPDVLLAAYQLAGLHREAGDPAAARRVLEVGLAAGQRRFGDADPLLLMISYELGSVAEELGNRHEARRNLARVAEAGPAVFGADHWAVRAAHSYLATGVLARPDGPRPVESAPGAAPLRPSAGRRGPASAPRGFPDPGPGSPPSPRRTAGSARPAHAPEPPPAEPPAAFGPAGPGLFSRRDHTAATRPRYGPTGPEAPVGRIPAGAPPRRGRGVAVTAGVAALAAVAAAILAAVAVLRDPDDTAERRSGPPATPTATAGTAGAPPTDVRVVQDGAEVIVTWRDPADGRAGFAVMGAPPGSAPRLLGQVPAGSTRLPVQGLNTVAGYCVRVVALYSAEEVGTSAQACLPPTPTPTPTPTDRP
ncbi:MAG TPA: tetratricopeptide repeat protein, partial [Pilimelia sp.]|nr:tetratricopeptide repeat protein [Pilimelia sp.]